MKADIPKRPAWWGQALFDRQVWSEQQKIIEAPFRDQFSAFPTGHGIGKTEVASMLPPLWMFSHFPTQVLVLSASWPNITGKLFPAMRAKLKRLKIPLVKDLVGKKLPQISRSFAIWELDDEWRCTGLSPEEPEVVQGWHAEAGTFVIVDEASELSWVIFDALMSLIKSRRDAIVLLGNPIRADGPFADILRRKPGLTHWKIHNIPTTKSPNYIATLRAIAAGEITEEEARSGEKEIIVINGLQTYSWVHRQIDMHGEGSAHVESRVYGRLPQQSPDTFIPRYLIMDCSAEPDDHRWPKTPGTRLILIIDPSWSETGDPMVFLVYDPDNDCVLHAEDHIGMSKVAAIKRTHELYETYPIIRMRIDEAGYGRGITEDLQKEGFQVEGINWSRSPHDPTLYMGSRDESYALCKRGLTTLIIPKRLIPRFEELSQIKFSETGPGGKLKIEGKKDFKKRGNVSPGYADCLAMIYTRLPGDPAFPHAGSTLKALMEPMIWKEEGRVWMVRFKEISPAILRPRVGTLLRSMWYSRRADSGAVWIHADDEGCWTVFDSYKGSFLSLSEFARQIYIRSFSEGREHDYAFDVLSAPMEAEHTGTVHMISDLHENLMGLGGELTPLPQFVTSARIGGMAGFEVLDRMILANLATNPEDDYWKVTGKDPDDFESDQILVIWPQNVVEELTHARLRQTIGARRDVEEDQPQEAVGGGGPLVRALRLLAVSGAGLGAG